MMNTASKKTAGKGFAAGACVALNADAAMFYPSIQTNVIYEVLDSKLVGYPGAYAYVYTIGHIGPKGRTTVVGSWIPGDELHEVT